MGAKLISRKEAASLLDISWTEEQFEEAGVDSEHLVSLLVELQRVVTALDSIPQIDMFVENGTLHCMIGDDPAEGGAYRSSRIAATIWHRHGSWDGGGF